MCIYFVYWCKQLCRLDSGSRVAVTSVVYVWEDTDTSVWVCPEPWPVVPVTNENILKI